MKSKTIKLCLQDYIFRSYRFLVEVMVAVSAINANENEYSQDNIAKKHRISQSQISRWIEKKRQHNEDDDSAHCKLFWKRSRTTKYNNLIEMLFIDFLNARYKDCIMNFF